MEHYLVSARKYRPSTFKTVVGQSALTSTLKNAIQTGRLAHSYLFCGSRGVGKTSCARIFAKTINCSNPTPDGEACNECDSCVAFNKGTSLNIVELDAASNNGVDAIRALVEQVQIPPAGGRYKVFIVDEVHMLSTAAFNAFLKTLEEPPEYVVFILATTEKNKIIPTILSRCQIYDFNRITVSDIASHLAFVAESEGIKAEHSALNVIAMKADGALRDALSIFDQIAASSRGEITYASTIANLNVLDNAVYFKLLDIILKGDVTGSWMVLKQVRDNGFDSHFFINGLADFLRDLMAARDASTRPLVDVSDEDWTKLSAKAAECAPDFLYRAMVLCNDADLAYKDASNKQFLVEVLLAKLCQPCSPSPDNSGSGEGRLKPIARSGAAPQPAGTQTPTAKPTPQATDQGTSPATKPQPATVRITPPQRPVSLNAGQQSQPSRPAPKGPPHMSIRQTCGQTEAAQSTPGQNSAQTVGTLRDNTFTGADLESAWDAFMKSHPKSHRLTNTMRVCRPKLVEHNRFVVVVESEAQQISLDEYATEMLGYLRDTLSNDHLTYFIDVNHGESSPRTWTEREVFDYLKENNPMLKKFVDEFKLTLA